jgi:hypothetical protein
VFALGETADEPGSIATTVHLTSRLKALTDILNEAVDMASTPVSAPLTNPDKPTRSNDVENISGQEVDTEPSLPGPSSSSPTPKEAESAITPDLNTAVPTATTPGPVQTQSWDRFQILLEIAEELSRFKVGVEDKVKVAGNACDHVSPFPSSTSYRVPCPESFPVN